MERILPSAFGLQGYSYQVETAPRYLPLHPVFSLDPYPSEAMAELELWPGSFWTAGDTWRHLERVGYGHVLVCMCVLGLHV